MKVFLHVWRHDSVLSTIISFINLRLRPGFALFSDLQGYQAPGGGVIPPNILVTNLRPDIVLINEVSREIVLFELTCPWEQNIDRNHAYKEGKYAPLVADLSRSFKVFQFSVEVAARGLITKQNKARLKSFALRSSNVGSSDLKKFIACCSKASLLSSFSIFRARNEPSWSSPMPLIVRADLP